MATRLLVNARHHVLETQAKHVEVHGDYLYIPQVSIEYYYQVYVEQHK
jgi:hypothetical protein